MTRCVQELFDGCDNYDALNQLLRRIDRLHSAPGVAQRLLRITRDIHFDLDEVVDCLRHDPALASRLLRVVNSAHYGLRYEVTGIRQAAALLGQRALRLLTLTFGIVESLTKGTPAEVYADFWRRSLTMASVAWMLAARTDDVRPDEAYTAGLLADVGILIIAQQHPEQYAQLYTETTHGDELNRVERETFGFGHAAAGAYFLQQWEVPDRLVEAVFRHHEDSGVFHTPFDALVRAGNLMADALWTSHSPSLAEVKSLLQSEFDMDTDDLIDLAINSRRDVLDAAESLEVRIGQPVDCETLIEEAQRRYTGLSLEAAIELDSLTETYKDAAC